MNKVPSIYQFLEEIDPKKTIDRKKAATDISMIIFLEAVNGTKSQLSKASQEKLVKGLQGNVDFEEVFSIFKEEGKLDDLFREADRKVDKVREDYLKTHLKTMTSAKREKVLAKFPSLKEIELEE
jgi:hypothetical protein